MDDALYMLVLCAGLSCTPVGRDGYYLTQAACFAKAQTVRRRSDDEIVKCQSGCG